MSATLPAPQHIDRDRVATLMEREQARLRERTAGSGEMFARASAVMPGGVPSQFQKSDPWPVYLDARLRRARSGTSTATSTPTSTTASAS